MKPAEENRRRNEYRREAIAQGIGSPARQHRYATARLKGMTPERAKAEAYSSNSKGY